MYEMNRPPDKLAAHRQIRYNRGRIGTSEADPMSEIKKTLALIAHDGKKADMVAFAMKHKTVLERYALVATSTTGELLQTKCGLEIKRVLSGPIGGDAQIAAQVAEGRIAAVFFFLDPLGKHPHDPDIQTLLRICNAHDVPLATNPATASFIISTQAL